MKKLLILLSFLSGCLGGLTKNESVALKLRARHAEQMCACYDRPCMREANNEYWRHRLKLPHDSDPDSKEYRVLSRKVINCAMIIQIKNPAPCTSNSATNGVHCDPK